MPVTEVAMERREQVKPRIVRRTSTTIKEEEEVYGCPPCSTEDEASDAPDAPELARQTGQQDEDPDEYLVADEPDKDEPLAEVRSKQHNQSRHEDQDEDEQPSRSIKAKVECECPPQDKGDDDDGDRDDE
jgi:hypothetical protein